jgi:hypothetical protein
MILFTSNDQSDEMNAYRCQLYTFPSLGGKIFTAIGAPSVTATSLDTFRFWLSGPMELKELLSFHEQVLAVAEKHALSIVSVQL